jgi:hypothetical protein
MNESVYTVFTTSDRPLSAIDADASPIIKALRFGITAPSAHNTQPWTIEIRSDTEASLSFDPTRSLPFTDPPGRQVHISHGTLLEMTAIAATSFGYRAEFDILPEGEMNFAEFGTKPTAHIKLVPTPDIEVDPLFDQILHRRTSRNNYEGSRVTEAEFKTIIEQSKCEGVDAGMIGGDRFAEALEIIKQAMAIEVNDRTLYGETLTWFRFSKREIAEKADGLNLFTVGLRGLTLQLARLMVRPRAFHSAMNRKSVLKSFNKATASTRGLLTLVTPTNTMSDWINTGRVYVRAQLAADALGLRFQPVSQSLQEFQQMNELRAQMNALVGVTTSEKLQMLVRVGRSQPPALSPRRELGSIVQTSR